MTLARNKAAKPSSERREKQRLEDTQRAVLNILEDFNTEKLRLEDTQRALLNILDDLNLSNEELQRAHDVLEVRVRERTAELQQSNSQLRAEMEERKKVEEALQSKTDELEATNKELESFSYTVSHDLRAPLRTMDGFSNILLEDYMDRLDSQGQAYLERIRSSSRLMAQLIEDLLTLSRISRTTLNMHNINLSELAKEVVSELKMAQPERQTEFKIAPRLEANGDKNLIKLVFENLLGNAFKFSGKCAQPIIEFGTKIEGREIIYFIRDNGDGFDMTYADKLFKPFQRLHSTTEFPGTGIGLASVQRIIHRHGGRVWAEGEKGKGATFYFTLC